MKIKQDLIAFLPPKFALGFSGGADSACLLALAVEYGCDVAPYFIQSPFQPQFEWQDAQKVCQHLGVTLKKIELNTLTNHLIAENTENRCYYCKKLLFQTLKAQAHDDGYEIICDGTHASDDVDARPGWRALQELGVQSPLRHAGLTKSDILHLSAVQNLPTANKPPYACLATRIPHGMPISQPLLTRIEQAENALRSLGFSNFRIRIFHDAARLQLSPKDMLRAVQEAQIITNAVSPYFKVVLLDLAITR